MLLDLGLPGEDGFAIARQLREHWHCGLVIVTGRGDAVDKVVGLEVGADDYVTKPFDLRELLARIKAVLRRLAPAGAAPAAAPAAPRAPLRFAGWELDTAGAPAARPAGPRGGADRAASSTCCARFARHPGRVLSRDFLLEQTRGREAGAVRPHDRRPGRPAAQEARGRSPTIRRSSSRCAAPATSSCRRSTRPDADDAPAPADAAAGVDDATVFRSLFAAYPDALLLVDDAAARSCSPTRRPRSCSATRSTSWSGLPVDDAGARRIRPRHAAYREAYGAQPAAAADGHADGAGRQAHGRQRGDGRDRAQPAAGPRPAARRRGDPRHRRLSAREAGAAARALQRARWRRSAGWRSTRAIRRCCSSRCRRSPPRRCRSRWRWSSCSSRTGSSSASPAASACCPAKRSAQRVPNRPRHAARLRARRRAGRWSSPTTRTRRASRVPHAYLDAGLTSALAVPLSDRGRTIGVLAVRSRAARSASATTRCASSSRCRTCSPRSLQRAQTRGGAEPCAAARERRPADRRHRARLQQPAHRDPGQPAGARGAARPIADDALRAAARRRGRRAPRGAAPS